MSEQEDLDSKFMEKVAEIPTWRYCLNPWQSQFDTKPYSEEKLDRHQ